MKALPLFVGGKEGVDEVEHLLLGHDRLKTATSAAFGGDGVHRFGYDALDNLKSWTLAGVKDYAEYFYDPTTWRLTNIRNASGATVVGLGYDVQGNLANKNGQVHTFDHGNRLRTALGTESYRYDAHGRRILAQSPSGKSFALYGVDGALLWERDERVSARLEYVYLGGSLLATRRRPIGSTNETVYYYHNDALGSQVALTDAAGAVAQRSEYDPFGGLTNRVANNRPGYTGHVMDAPTGLTYMQQRYYDPGIGWFLSVDPVSADTVTGWNFNRYNYAANNPYKFIDPDGRSVACSDQKCTGTIESVVDVAKVAVAYVGALIVSALPPSQSNEAAESAPDAGAESTPDDQASPETVVSGVISGIREGKMHAPGEAGKRGELIGQPGEGQTDWEKIQNTPGAEHNGPNNVRLPDGSNANRHTSTRPFSDGPPTGTDTIKHYPPGSKIPSTTVRYPGGTQ